MGRIHPVTSKVAFGDNNRAFETGWFGDNQIFQDSRDIRVLVDPTGKIIPLEPQIGANNIRSGEFCWQSCLIVGTTPQLAFSDGSTKVGYVGGTAASADVQVFLDRSKTIATVKRTGQPNKDIRLPGGVAQEIWVDQLGQWLIGAMFRPDGKTALEIINLETEARFTPTCMTPDGQWGAAGVTLNGVRWIVYGTDKYGLVIHPQNDPTRRKIVAPPHIPGMTAIEGVDACLIGDKVHVIWFSGALQAKDELCRAIIPVADLLALPSIPIPVPPVQEALGPRSEPLPDGTDVDVASFFEYAPEFWPRGDQARGDDHGMDMQVLPDGRLWLAKFADEGKGALGEILSVDAAPDGFIHLLTDASNLPTIDVWPTDTRWLPKKMKIGRQFGFKSGIHQLEKRRRSDCTLSRPSQDFEKENWIAAVYPSYYLGEDLGLCEVMFYIYNNTGWDQGQNGSDELWVEGYLMARKNGKAVGWVGWRTAKSSDVFRNGGFSFPVDALKKWFARLGGKRYPPNVPLCVALPAVPPRVVPVPPGPPPTVPPIPTVPPVTAPVTAQQVATILGGALFDRICVHLGLPIGDGTQTANRPKVMAWMLARINFLEAAYKRVFKRGLLGVPGDYEAFGSRMVLYLELKLDDAGVERVLEAARDRGDK